MSRLFAIVEIDNGPLLLIISSVFIVAFAVVCAIAYLLLAKGRSTQSGWLLKSLYAAIAQPGAVTYPEHLLTAKPS